MSKTEILRKITEHALSKGLDPSEKLEFLKGSAIWKDLNKTQQKDVIASVINDCYFPGPIHIMKALSEKFYLKTIAEIDSDKEKIYFFNGQIYERAEEIIKAEAHTEYLKQWSKMLISAESNENKPLSATLRTKLDRGPSVNDINEVIAMIRRTTFNNDSMNPGTHIPFLNGLLNLKTRKLEPFTHNLFFTYQVNANFLTDRIVTLKDVPLFTGLLNTVFYEPDIPLILSYFAYSFYPDLPMHKVLFIIGRERIGKGTCARVLQWLMPKGSGSVSLVRLLTSERFQFTGIEGKNILVDSEIKRKFKRGTVIEWSAFCNLFGKDVLSVEPKGHEAHDYVSKAKGIFLGNLPFITVDSPPAISRMIIVQTRDERPRIPIPDLDKKIIAAERDEIATLLMKILFNLMEKDFQFPGQMTDDSTAMVLDQLADPVENFIEEETESIKDKKTSVKEAYSRFVEWSKSKGISILARPTFTKRFGYSFYKKLLGSRGNREYYFIDCQLNGADEGDEVQRHLRVEHGVNSQETLKISLSGERYRRVQHLSMTPTRYEKKIDPNNGHNIEGVEGQFLNTGLIASAKPENKASVNNESVFKLHEENEVFHESEKDDNIESSDLKIQSERKRWKLNPKLELFNLVEEYAPKSKYRSLTAKAIHDMIAMYGIDLSTIHDLCEQLHKEGAFSKNDAGAYSVNKKFLEGGDYR